MQSLTWIKQTDVQARLNLFRYGLIVINIVAFVAVLLAPWAVFFGTDLIPDADKPSILIGLRPALLVGAITLVITLVSYFVYREILKRTVGKNTESESGESES